MAPAAGRRSTYRHGDLANALLRAGVELAREGGPDGVVLREATRRAGVAPNAAYRHFADRAALLAAVRGEASATLARAMEAEQERIPPDAPPPARAAAMLRATGSGYLRFAQDEPGLFRTAFAPPVDPPHPRDDSGTGGRGLNPLGLLAEALDACVDAGVLPADRRADADLVAWSAVHGLAMLLVDGPLHALPPADAARVADRLLDTVLTGL